VNNAGHYGPVLPVEEYPLEELSAWIDVHLRARSCSASLCLPGMYARKNGVILIFPAFLAKAAYGWGSAYAAAKLVCLD